MARNASVERFRKLTEELQRECLAAAKDELGTQAEKLTQTIKGVCPVNADPKPTPGLLRDSIGWTFGDPPKTRASGAFRPKAGGSKSDLVASVYAGNDEAFYARWVEFGTEPHSLAKGADLSSGAKSRRIPQSSGAQHPGAAAHPFFYPTYRLMKKRIRSAVKRKLNASIKKRSAE